jgi:uncharacterized protein (DUF2141 family)
MKYVPLLLVIGLLSISFSYAENGLKIEITNLRNNNGFVLVSLFKEKEGFPDNSEKAVKKLKLGISNKKASIILKDITPGIYAIAILHDENNDQKMNSNSLGIPKEGYGFSNNVFGVFGPPSFRKASFTYSGKYTAITIKTKY